MTINKTFITGIAVTALLLLPHMAAAQGATRSINEDLMYRITFGRVEDIKDLLEKGAEPNSYGGLGDTPITIAITRKTNDAVDIIRALMAKGADPNFTDKNGVYPLEVAIKYGRASVVKTLIEGGADIHLKNLKGISMSDLALKQNNPEIIELITLRQKKEDEQEVELRNPERLLPLMQQFGAKVCEYAYWSNYLASGQNPEDDTVTKEKVGKAKALAEKIGSEISRYFPTININSFIKYASSNIANVFTSLKDNKTRLENGIGKDEDMYKRCTPIAEATRASVASVLEAQRKASEEAARRAAAQQR